MHGVISQKMLHKLIGLQRSPEIISKEETTPWRPIGRLLVVLNAEAQPDHP
jgi:hypothetical protein